MADRADLVPLEMSAPPWWDEWQAWADQRDQDVAHYIEEKDPREWMHIDDLAYEVGIKAFGDGYETLLGQLARLSPGSMQGRVHELLGQLTRHKERIRGR